MLPLSAIAHWPPQVVSSFLCHSIIYFYFFFHFPAYSLAPDYLFHVVTAWGRFLDVGTALGREVRTRLQGGWLNNYATAVGGVVLEPGRPRWEQITGRSEIWRRGYLCNMKLGSEGNVFFLPPTAQAMALTGRERVEEEKISSPVIVAACMGRARCICLDGRHCLQQASNGDKRMRVLWTTAGGIPGSNEITIGIAGFRGRQGSSAPPSYCECSCAQAKCTGKMPVQAEPFKFQPPPGSAPSDWPHILPGPEQHTAWARGQTGYKNRARAANF